LRDLRQIVSTQVPEAFPSSGPRHGPVGAATSDCDRSAESSVSSQPRLRKSGPLLAGLRAGLPPRLACIILMSSIQNGLFGKDIRQFFEARQLLVGRVVVAVNRQAARRMAERIVLPQSMPICQGRGRITFSLRDATSGWYREGRSDYVLGVSLLSPIPHGGPGQCNFPSST